MSRVQPMLLPSQKAARRDRALLARDAVRALATAALAFVVCWVGAWVYSERAWAPEAAGEQVGDAVSTVRRLQTEQHRVRLEAAVNVFLLRHAALPATLDDLVREGLIDESELRWPGYTRAYFYRPAGSTFTLLPPAY